MNIKQLAPWNWFKDEEGVAGAPVPVRHESGNPNSGPPLMHLHQEIDRLFDDMLRGFPGLHTPSMLAPRLVSEANWMKPSLDIGASQSEYTIAVELPGVEESDIELEVMGDALCIRGEKQQESEKKDRDYYCVERSYGSFQRRLSLPQDADRDQIEAKFRRGVLTVCIPRVEVKTEDVRQIEVKAA